MYKLLAWDNYVALIRFEQQFLVLPDLYKLKPFHDENGIYWDRTRPYNMAHLSMGDKFPIILPER